MRLCFKKADFFLSFSVEDGQLVQVKPYPPERGAVVVTKVENVNFDLIFEQGCPNDKPIMPAVNWQACTLPVAGPPNDLDGKISGNLGHIRNDFQGQFAQADSADLLSVIWPILYTWFYAIIQWYYGVRFVQRWVNPVRYQCGYSALLSRCRFWRPCFLL